MLNWFFFHPSSCSEKTLNQKQTSKIQMNETQRWYKKWRCYRWNSKPKNFSIDIEVFNFGKKKCIKNKTIYFPQRPQWLEFSGSPFLCEKNPLTVFRNFLHVTYRWIDVRDGNNFSTTAISLLPTNILNRFMS